MRNPDHSNARSPEMKAILTGGALDGHVMAIGAEITAIRVRTPWCVHIYGLVAVCPSANGPICHFKPRNTTGPNDREAISTNLIPLAQLAWRESGYTDAATDAAGRFELVGNGVDCA